MSDLEELGWSAARTPRRAHPHGLAYRLFIDTMLVTKPLDSASVQQMESQLQPTIRRA